VADVTLVVGHGQQEQFTGNELITALDGLFLGRLQQRDHVAPDLHLLLAFHLRQFLDGGFGGGRQARHIDTGALQQRLGAVLLAQHGHQQVGRLDVGVVIAQGQRLRFAQGFLEFGGQFVYSHEILRLHRSFGCLP